ncbi:CCA tRNA nucleotidyltransferase [Sulfitobacter geojensis]|uniref:CCA tRNA nucleotidyltransferase n=1 Tax=Sulfitobacter geojensis TaxID=1342299 RepID=A0AAE2VXT5_9RHOB|nr:CCA tRNA nucleotidyltransferase [Sulfitobacter geojensis]MBM1689384.1 CCA tRNA nucleotidyltransferase [Sulfitobacter geojensis]MBM1693450.1 CCA tRNA nucleotidyltransferase [Sulfitobacter geojensis]MBM1705616.1 CCA tRNA nucleotidyltransferase [Sulfitobacter geojensis]MBM1709674.1 CCA tRNA nucleotidyltransferase [Sulfitobacter geojensis]MBM1713740.1 CCA tRNA nucleotidyltransferase [Sulfitobacter geojensis]
MIPADTSWLQNPEAQDVCAVITAAGFDVFFVGGCVRNAIMRLADSDIDMSTNARPEKVMELATSAGLKAIPTGIDHGTVTVVVNGTPFEITTFRRDVETDGRHAVVAFSDNIHDDARRRDFTMNALYATPEGQVVDPLGGMDDLLARRIRFIEDPDARIKEDYLRILRFFRFSAWYGNTVEGFDAEALAAISTNTEGLETLSAERVGQEMVKLLNAPDPAPAVAVMRQTGVLSTVLPGSDDRMLAILIHMETALGIAPDWKRRLAVLGGDDPAARFRLSKAAAQKLALLREVGFSGPPVAEIAYRHGVEVGQSTVLLRAVLAEQMPDSALLETVLSAAEAKFPVTASDLMPEFQGPALGKKLRHLEQRWIDSGFALSAQELLRGA